MKNQDPDLLAVALDRKAPTFRHSQFKEYKANRKPMPDELRPQVPILERIIAAYNIPVYYCDGYEADDVMGTIVKDLAGKDIDIFLVSRDKDLEQLIDDKVQMFDVKKNTFYDKEMMELRRGVKPSQWVDVLALVGDPSDNIPGVPGIGSKTATNLISRWQTLDDVFANIDKISARRAKEALVQNAEQARLSRFLVTINREAPIEFDLEGCRDWRDDTQELKDIFAECGFKSFMT